jgi:hypothetical protein
VDLVEIELAFVVALVDELQQSLPVLAAVLVLAFVDLSVGPDLTSHAVLLVFEPFADVAGSVGVRVGAMPTCLIVEPLAIVHISIGMVQDTSPIGLVVLPLAYVPGAICPNLRSHALPLSVHPLPLVGDSVVEFYHGHFDFTHCCDDLPDQFVILIALPSPNEVLAHLLLALRHDTFLRSLLRGFLVVGLAIAGSNRLSTVHLLDLFEFLLLSLEDGGLVLPLPQDRLDFLPAVLGVFAGVLGCFDVFDLLHDLLFILRLYLHGGVRCLGARTDADSHSSSIIVLE